MLDILEIEDLNVDGIHPNCWDISGAGHIKTGEIVITGAIRELKKELGVGIAEKDLQYITKIKSINIKRYILLKRLGQVQNE